MQSLYPKDDLESTILETMASRSWTKSLYPKDDLESTFLPAMASTLNSHGIAANYIY